MLAVSLPQSISSPWSNQSTNLHRDEGFSCGKKIRDSNPLRSKNYLAFLHPCRLGHGRPRLSQTPENFNLQLRLSWVHLNTKTEQPCLGIYTKYRFVMWMWPYGRQKGLPRRRKADVWRMPRWRERDSCWLSGSWFPTLLRPKVLPQGPEINLCFLI